MNVIYIICKMLYPQDVDNFFQNERNKNTNIATLSKVATEVHYLSCFSVFYLASALLVIL